MAKYQQKEMLICNIQALNFILRSYDQGQFKKKVKYQQEGVITRNIYVNYVNTNTRPGRGKERRRGNGFRSGGNSSFIFIFFTFCGNHYSSFKMSSWLSPDPSPVQGASSPSPSLTKNLVSAPAHCSKVIRIWFKFSKRSRSLGQKILKGSKIQSE